MLSLKSREKRFILIKHLGLHTRWRGKKTVMIDFLLIWVLTIILFSRCRRDDSRGRFRIAVGSYMEEYTNQFQIIQLEPQPQSQITESQRFS